MKPNPTQALLEAASEERAISMLVETITVRERIPHLAWSNIRRAVAAVQIGR